MIRLLSLDFDGTVVDHASHMPVSRVFLNLLDELRSDGVLWAINTGRALHHIVEGIDESHLPILPDFVLTAEREVFRPAPGGGWEDFGDWNRRCTAAHESLFAETRHFLDEMKAFVGGLSSGEFIDDASGIGVCVADPAELGVVLERVEAFAGQHPQFHYQRNNIWIRFCHIDYSKGTALAELSRLLGLGPEAIFAAGDHYNDLAMLDGRYARWLACPANAVDAVKRAVESAGGYVARQPYSAGVAEAVRHFLDRSR
jgi:hydroxymethylpyrimidine pyrophosphatase-like HAD family hydrolase